MGISNLSGDSAHGSVSWGWASATRMRVSPQNVLRVAEALIDESAGFRTRVAARLESLCVEHTGGDPVSAVAATALNDRFWRAPDSLANRCLDYADMLDALADQLAAAARDYGHTEDAIAAVFAKRDPDYADRPAMHDHDQGRWRPGGSLDGRQVG